MFAGQMACEALNWVLKRYIKEERPRRMIFTISSWPKAY
jgi:dolichyldiphosphatase